MTMTPEYAQKVADEIHEEVLRTTSETIKRSGDMPDQNEKDNNKSKKSFFERHAGKIAAVGAAVATVGTGIAIYDKVKDKGAADALVGSGSSSVLSLVEGGAEGLMGGIGSKLFGG